MSAECEISGRKAWESKTPADCVMLAEGHGGWNKVTPGDPSVVVTDWTGSTDLQNKWHHEYSIGVNSTFFMSALAYNGLRMIRVGLPFYNNGGNVAYADGHQAFIQYSNPDGSPVLCHTMPWTKSMDPRQRAATFDSCTDPNNPVGNGFQSSNWF